MKNTRISTSRRLAQAEIPACFAQATYAAAANAFERDSRSAKASRRRLSDKAMKLAATPEPRVSPVCEGTGTCMLCDDNGMVPASSLNGGQRAKQNEKPATLGSVRAARLLFGDEADLASALRAKAAGYTGSMLGGADIDHDITIFRVRVASRGAV